MNDRPTAPRFVSHAGSPHVVGEEDATYGFGGLGDSEGPAHDPVNAPAHYTLGSVDWKPVPGFEGLYSVSSDGDILSHKTNRMRAKCAWEQGRYLTINFYRNGVASKPMHIHRLVAEAFLPKPSDEASVVNHRNGDKQDNRVENLEWLSSSENSLHAYDTGLRGWALKPASAARDLSPRERLAIRKLSGQGVTAEALAEAFFTTIEVIDAIL